VKLTGLHFLLTYTCTSECDHCFVHSSPSAPGTMTLAQVRDALDQAADLGTVTQVWFEGGEPFLYHPLLSRGVRLAAARGLAVGAVTNAYFATTVEDATLWLKPLVDAGLTSLSVSADEYHGTDGDGPAMRTHRAAALLGIECDSICIEAPRCERGAHSKGEPILGGGVRFRGRAADALTEEGLPRRAWQDFDECPDEDWVDVGRLHLDAYGNLYPCQGVVVGNLQRASLRSIVETYDPDPHPIIGPLLRGGPAELVRAHDLDIGGGYLDACHLCYTVRRRLRDRFPRDLAPPQVYGART
jgi:MoaA/NifB/PqqE/SkfB family radical SAM enzyme